MLHWTGRLVGRMESGGDEATGSRDISQEAIAPAPAEETQTPRGCGREWEVWGSVSRMRAAARSSSVSSLQG